MADILLQQTASYIVTQNNEPLLLQSSLTLTLNNYMSVGVADGMSTAEKTR